MARRKEHRTHSLAHLAHRYRDGYVLVALAALTAVAAGRRAAVWQQPGSSDSAAPQAKPSRGSASVFLSPLFFGYFSASHAELCEFRWRICHCRLRVGPRRLSSALSCAHFRKGNPSNKAAGDCIRCCCSPAKWCRAVLCRFFLGAVPALACILGSPGLASPIRSHAAKISSAPKGGSGIVPAKAIFDMPRRSSLVGRPVHSLPHSSEGALKSTCYRRRRLFTGTWLLTETAWMKTPRLHRQAARKQT